MMIANPTVPAGTPVHAKGNEAPSPSPRYGRESSSPSFTDGLLSTNCPLWGASSKTGEACPAPPPFPFFRGFRQVGLRSNLAVRIHKLKPQHPIRVHGVINEVDLVTSLQLEAEVCPVRGLEPRNAGPPPRGEGWRTPRALGWGST